MTRVYNGFGEVIEVTIRDGTGAKIEKRVANINDEESIKIMFDWILNKYGVNFKPKGFLDLNDLV